MITGEHIQEHWVMNNPDKLTELLGLTVYNHSDELYKAALENIVVKYAEEQALIQPVSRALEFNYYVENTTKRIAKSFEERFDGYKLTTRPNDPGKTIYEQISFFPETKSTICKNNIICIKNIEFTSTCEHHWLPIVGTMDIAYIPITHVYGLSKIPRIMNTFAHRLQQQERLGSEISRAIVEYGNITESGVFDGSYKIMAALCNILAMHTCMSCRGVRQTRSYTTTSHFYCLPFEDAKLSSFEYYGDNEEAVRDGWRTHDEVFYRQQIANSLHTSMKEHMKLDWNF